MQAQPSTTPAKATPHSGTQQPDHGTALVLGAVLGLLLASGAAAAVGGWQLSRINLQSTTLPAPSYLTDDNAYDTNTYGNNGYGANAYGNNTNTYRGENAYAAPPQVSSPASHSPYSVPIVSDENSSNGQVATPTGPSAWRSYTNSFATPAAPAPPDLEEPDTVPTETAQPKPENSDASQPGSEPADGSGTSEHANPKGGL